MEKGNTHPELKRAFNCPGIYSLRQSIRRNVNCQRCQEVAGDKKLADVLKVMNGEVEDMIFLEENSEMNK